jgi:hypothetical protein
MSEHEDWKYVNSAAKLGLKSCSANDAAQCNARWWASPDDHGVEFPGLGTFRRLALQSTHRPNIPARIYLLPGTLRQSLPLSFHKPIHYLKLTHPPS